jgi:hypothetical protein
VIAPLSYDDRVPGRSHGDAALDFSRRKISVNKIRNLLRSGMALAIAALTACAAGGGAAGPVAQVPIPAVFQGYAGVVVVSRLATPDRVVKRGFSRTMARILSEQIRMVHAPMVVCKTVATCSGFVMLEWFTEIASQRPGSIEGVLSYEDSRTGQVLLTRHLVSTRQYHGILEQIAADGVYQLNASFPIAALNDGSLLARMRRTQWVPAGEAGE